MALQITTNHKHAQLKALLLEELKEGKFKPGDRFYSENELVKIYGISKFPVIKALTEFVSEGWLHRIQGKGTFVAHPSLRRSNNIGIALFSLRYLEGEFFPDIIDAIREEAGKRNYNLLFCPLDKKTGTENSFWLKVAEKKQVDGWVIIESDLEKEDIARLRDLKCPFILVDRYLPQANCVLIDNEKGAYEVSRHLMELGHRKIGLILGSIQSKVDQDKLKGYKAALENHGLKYQESLVRRYSGDCLGKVAYKAAESLLDVPEPPTAIMTTDDIVAAEVLRAARHRRLRVPEDLSLVGSWDRPVAQSLEPPLTTVRPPYEEMGRVITKMFFSLLEGEETKEQRIILEPQLIIRGSSGKCVITGANPAG